MVKPKYKPGSAWKRGNWDKWSFWRKVRHCFAVLGALIIVATMFLASGVLILHAWGLEAMIFKLRDQFLLEIMRKIFG